MQGRQQIAGQFDRSKEIDFHDLSQAFGSGVCELADAPNSGIIDQQIELASVKGVTPPNLVWSWEADHWLIRSARLAIAITWQPLSASSCVKHLPIPLLAPVTTASESLGVHGICFYLSRLAKRIHATSVELSLTGLSVRGRGSGCSDGLLGESVLDPSGSCSSQTVAGDSGISFSAVSSSSSDAV